MIKKLLYIAAIALFFAKAVTADPSDISVSGTVSDGETITISGANFGTKSTAAPTVWDNCDHEQSVATRWDGAWPDSSEQPLSTPRYATPAEINSIATAHSRATHYLAARSYDGAESGEGFPNDPGVWKHLTALSSYPTYLYISVYQRADDNYVIDGTPSNRNYKYLDYSGGNSPYDSSGNWYLEYYNGLGGTHHINDNDAGLFENTPANCNDYYGMDYLCNNWYFGASVDIRSAWEKVEIVAYITDNDATGWMDVYSNGSLRINTSTGGGTGPHSYNGAVESTITGTARNILIGGYSRISNSANWRYWNDIYIDETFARVMICTGSTWAEKGNCEPQPPTSWGTTSIQVTVNQASFEDEATAYVYVVDSANTANSSGYEITFGEGQPTISGETISGCTLN